MKFGELRSAEVSGRSFMAGWGKERMVLNVKTGLVWEIILACFWSCPAVASILATPKVDLERLGGQWYPIAVVRDRPLKKAVHAYRIEPVGLEDFLLVQAVPHKGRCKEVKHHLHATWGSFRTSDAENVIRFMDTDYDSYHIALFEKGSDAALFLYARAKQVSGEVKTRLQKQALKWGFKNSQIVYNPITGLCPLPHGRKLGLILAFPSNVRQETGPFQEPPLPSPSELQRHGGQENVFCNFPYLFYILPWWPGLCDPLQTNRS